MRNQTFHNQRPRGVFRLTAKNGMTIAGIIGLAASIGYWWSIQSLLTPHRMIAGAMTMIMALAPSALAAFLFPWSPAGMLLQKIMSRTWGYVVIIASMIVLLYYSFQMTYAWWSTQPGITPDLVWKQVIVALIGYIFIPGLVWAPTRTDELVAQIHEATLVRRIELMTEADITILRQQLLHAQVQTLVGMAGLTIQEREELAGAMRGIVRGIDGSLEQLAASLDSYGRIAQGFDALDDNQAVQGHFNDAAKALRSAKVLQAGQRTADQGAAERALPSGKPRTDEQQGRGQPAQSSREQGRGQPAQSSREQGRGQPAQSSREQGREQPAQSSRERSGAGGDRPLSPGREREQGPSRPAADRQQPLFGDDELSDQEMLSLREELMRERAGAH